MLITDEKLQSIIVSQAPYEMIRDVFDEVYSTVNDKYLLISKELFHYIVGNLRAISSDLITTDEKQIVISERYYDFLTKGSPSVEAIEELYGATIIQRYFERQKQENNTKKLKNLSRGNHKHKAYADNRRAWIISLVLSKYTKKDIEEMVGVSRSTVDRALRGLDALTLSSIVAQYKEVYFYDLDQQAYKEFIGVGCSYAKFRKLLAEKSV